MKKNKSIINILKDSWTVQIIFVLFIINFLYQSFVIPSGSMRSTLLEGDFVVVNKYAYGTPIPVIPFINLPLLPDFNKNGHLIEGDRPQREDIVIFKGERTDNNYYVKRCIATENDILFFEYGDLYIHFNEGDDYIRKNYPNNEYYESPKYGLFVKNPYMNKHKGIQNKIYSHLAAVKLEQDYYSNFDLVLKYQKEGDPIKESKDYFTKNGLTGTFEEMKNEYLSIVNEELNQSLYYAQNFPNHPLINDKKKYFENIEFINEENKTFAKVKKDKFFMVGDNRNYSKDSRFMDAIPYKEIQGKLVGIWSSFVYFSEDRPQLRFQPRWHRFGSDLEDLRNSNFEKYRNEVEYQQRIISWQEILKNRKQEIDNKIKENNKETKSKVE
jgi:signal peptidase I